MKLFTWLIFGVCLAGCSNSTPSVNQVIVLDSLYDQHDQWQGTPYQLGGNDKQGIDCSGFVALTFAELFNINLPRSTRQQAKIDAEIPRSMIKTADLVFFNIPDQGGIYHVGIYLRDGNFLHASTSRGVMISNLKAKYWSDNYWKAIRVLK